MSGDRLPVCRSCDKAFSSGRALTQHRRFVHEGARLIRLPAD